MYMYVVGPHIWNRLPLDYQHWSSRISLRPQNLSLQRKLPSTLVVLKFCWTYATLIKLSIVIVISQNAGLPGRGGECPGSRQFFGPARPLLKYYSRDLFLNFSITMGPEISVGGPIHMYTCSLDDRLHHNLFYQVAIEEGSKWWKQSECRFSAKRKKRTYLLSIFVPFLWIFVSFIVFISWVVIFEILKLVRFISASFCHCFTSIRQLKLFVI